MPVRGSGRPAGRIAGMKYMVTVVFNHGRLARDQVQKLVLCFVPMSFDGSRPWLERLDIGAALGQSADLRVAQQFEGSVALRPVLCALIVLWLILSNDHPFLLARAVKPGDSIDSSGRRL